MNNMKNFVNLDTPVLLIIFNRPEQTRRVFESIRAVRPIRLYVAADGPRNDHPSDLESCSEARGIVDLVDWECEVKTLFQKSNLNCGKGPAAAISWLFENEEYGIILEDDCVASQSFFYYCQELLLRYRYDDRVMEISGTNPLGRYRLNGYTYYFAKYGSSWGWASWRRAWQHFDYNLSLYSKMREEGFLDNMFDWWINKQYFYNIYNNTIKDLESIDWWDYQWEFARFINSGLTIVPRTNLVQNIGFGDHATHTFFKVFKAPFSS